MMTAFGPGFTCSGAAARGGVSLGDPRSSRWSRSSGSPNCLGRAPTRGGCSPPAAMKSRPAIIRLIVALHVAWLARLVVVGAGPAGRACRCSALFGADRGRPRSGSWRRSAGAGRRGSSSSPAKPWCGAAPIASSTIPIMSVVVGRDRGAAAGVRAVADGAGLQPRSTRSMLWIRIRAENCGARPLAETLACAGPGAAYIALVSPRHRQMLRLGPSGPGPRDVLTVRKDASDRYRRTDPLDRARGQGPGLRPRARGDDRRRVRPDAAGDGRAARHAPARHRRLRSLVAAPVRDARRSRRKRAATRSTAAIGSKSRRPGSTGR